MRPVILAAGLAAAACAAQAQSLSPTLQTGLWEEEVQIMINGQDLRAVMHQARQAMLARTPADQRKQLEAMLEQQGDPMAKSFDCLGPKEVAEMADPARALAKSMREEPLCTAQVLSVSGGSFTFKSVCKDPDKFSGEFNGEYSVLDSKRWTYSMTGRGKVAGGSAALGGVGASKDGTVEMKNSGQARWVSADCGKHKRQG